jgi:hypothetical protein
LRVLQRCARYYGHVREDMAPGCPERFDWEFLKHVWMFPEASRPHIVAALERHGGNARLHQLRSQADTERLLESVKTG